MENTNKKSLKWLWIAIAIIAQIRYNRMDNSLGMPFLQNYK